MDVYLTEPMTAFLVTWNTGVGEVIKDTYFLVRIPLINTSRMSKGKSPSLLTT